LLYSGADNCSVHSLITELHSPVSERCPTALPSVLEKETAVW